MMSPMQMAANPGSGIARIFQSTAAPAANTADVRTRSTMGHCVKDVKPHRETDNRSEQAQRATWIENRLFGFVTHSASPFYVGLGGMDGTARSQFGGPNNRDDGVPHSRLHNVRRVRAGLCREPQAVGCRSAFEPSIEPRLPTDVSCATRAYRRHGILNSSAVERGRSLRGRLSKSHHIGFVPLRSSDTRVSIGRIAVPSPSPIHNVAQEGHLA